MKNGLQEEYYKDGSLRIQRWYKNDKLHREGGPAMIHYYESGVISSKFWMSDDQPHRIGGPATTLYCQRGKIEETYWYERGKFIHKNNIKYSMK